MARSDKLYANSPRMERGEDGNMGVSKPTEADGENMGTEGNPTEGNPGQMPVNVHQMHERHEMHHKHATEHLQLHRRHELDHAMAGETDKKVLHKHHEKELEEMHNRHHEEMKSMHKKHETLKGGSAHEDTEDWKNTKENTAPKGKE